MLEKKSFTFFMALTALILLTGFILTQTKPKTENQGKVTCKNRQQVCTMECIINPPYICGSDGKSYCSACQACSNSKVEWYQIKETPCGGM